MFSPSRKVREELVKMLKWSIIGAYPEVKLESEAIELSISEPKRAGAGDVSTSIAFRISKMTGHYPHQVTEKLIQQMKLYKMLATNLFATATEDNGYINLTINHKDYSRMVLDGILERKEFYGFTDMGKGKRVIVESPSVNPNKPWHIGHLRNALLGDALSGIMSASGYNVERQNYIDDLGLQIAESIWGVKNLPGAPDKKYDTWLGEQYVLVNKRLKEDQGMEVSIKEINKRMEEPGSEDAVLARQTAERCVKAQYETAADYGISHDVLIWESDIVGAKLLETALSIADRKGVLEKPREGKYAGCTIVKLDKAKGMENQLEDTKVLVRSNGAANYTAKDIAFHMWKFGLIEDTFKYAQFLERQANGKPLYSTDPRGDAGPFFGHADKVVNIIGEEQTYSQLTLKAVLGLMGMGDIADRIVHVSYGRVSVEKGSLSGREGGWIGDDGKSYTADSLLREVTGKANEIAQNSKKIIDKEKAPAIAKGIALSAIKFEFLKVSPEKKVVFSWERALNFEGNSGPYCMYTYTRAKRILEKAEYKEPRLTDKDFDMVGRQMDFELIKHLGRAQEAVEKACSEARPNILTDYLLGLAMLFGSFYEHMPVIKGEDAREVRLAMVFGVMQVMGNLLNMLGIDVVESM